LRTSQKTQGRGAKIGIYVTPNAKKDQIQVHDGVVKVWVCAPAKKDKANQAVIKLLKPHIGRCKIIKGLNRRKKTILVHSRSEDEVFDLLGFF